jgi:hypothetical protein
MKKTVLSLAISFALWGGMPNSYAQTSPPPMGQAAQQQPMPQSGGKNQQQPPQPTGNGQAQPPQPTGDGQAQPPQPTGDGQAQPPQPTDDGQAQPPQPTGDGQAQPPQPTGDGQAQPPQPTGDGQAQPPQPTGDGQAQPPQPTGDGQAQPPQPTGDGQAQPPQPTGDGQAQPPQPTGDGQAQPPQPTGDGQAQPPQPTGDGQAQPPQPTGDGQAQPPQPTGDGQAQPPQPSCSSQQTGKPSGSAVQQCQSRPEDFGIKPKELDRFDDLKEEEIRAFGPQDIRQVQPHAFNHIGSTQVKEMSKKALEGMTSTQFQQMPTEALAGLDANNMGGLPPAVIQQFRPQHVKKLDKSQVKAMSGKEVGKLLVNMDSSKIQANDVKDLLPDGWQIEGNGGIKVPTGTQLTLPSKSQKQSMSTKVKMPEMPDVSKGFGLGGNAVGGKTVLQGLNEALAQAGAPNFSFKQQDNGSLIVEGSGEASGVQLAFMPASNEMMQTEKGAPIAQDETGRFVIITPENQQFPMIPTVKDPERLAEVIPGEGKVQIGESGDTSLKLPNQAEHSQVVGMVDSLVTPAPSGMSPGVHFAQTADGKEEAILVYQDGTMQQMRPTCPSPQQFIEKGEEIGGVEKLTHQMDGTFALVFMGKRYRLQPTFDVQVEPVPEDEVVEPSILPREDGSLEYIVQDGGELLHTRVVIEDLEEEGIEGAEEDEEDEEEEENEVIIENEI